MADVDLRELQMFLVLAEELHFGRTAERLGLTSSRVRQTVRALERKLGGPRLFDRISRVVTLTETGAALRRDLVPTLANLDEVVLRARERGAGPGLLTVGVLNAASGVAVLNRAVSRFESLHPGGTVRLVERFLIYGDYELVASTTPSLPAELKVARLDELARQHPEGFGRWVVKDRDGNVLDEFGPPPG